MSWAAAMTPADIIDANVTMRFRINSVCDESDLTDSGMTLAEMVADLIRSEGICNLVDDMDAAVLVSVERVKR